MVDVIRVVDTNDRASPGRQLRKPFYLFQVCYLVRNKHVLDPGINQCFGF